VHSQSMKKGSYAGKLRTPDHTQGGL
jgi:hypothetical protein